MPDILLHDPARAGFKLTPAAFAALLLLNPPHNWGPQ